jgi:hypothetical protein
MIFKFQLKALRIRFFDEKYFSSVFLRDLRASVVNKTHITFLNYFLVLQIIICK